MVKRKAVLEWSDQEKQQAGNLLEYIICGTGSDDPVFKAQQAIEKAQTPIASMVKFLDGEWKTPAMAKFNAFAAAVSGVNPETAEGKSELLARAADLEAISDSQKKWRKSYATLCAQLERAQSLAATAHIRTDGGGRGSEGYAERSILRAMRTDMREAVIDDREGEKEGMVFRHVCKTMNITSAQLYSALNMPERPMEVTGVEPKPDVVPATPEDSAILFELQKAFRRQSLGVRLEESPKPVDGEDAYAHNAVSDNGKRARRVSGNGRAH